MESFKHDASSSHVRAGMSGQCVCLTSLVTACFAHVFRFGYNLQLNLISRSPAAAASYEMLASCYAQHCDTVTAMQQPLSAAEMPKIYPP